MYLTYLVEGQEGRDIGFTNSDGWNSIPALAKQMLKLSGGSVVVKDVSYPTRK